MNNTMRASASASSALPIFDFNETLLSPKDLERHVSLRVRVFLFVSAWGSMAWFLVAPFVDSIRVGYGVSLIVFQFWWLSIMLWVCRWDYHGIETCQRKFDEAMARLRAEKGGHSVPPGGYTVPELMHWVIVPNYKEDVDMLRATLNAIAMQSVGTRRICVLLAAEGAERGVLEKLAPLAAEFPEFRKFVINVHQLREGEIAGKSSNTSAAFRSLCAAVYKATKDARLARVADALELDFAHWHESPDTRGNDFSAFNAVLERGVITVMDADSILHPFHLYGIEESYHFEHHSARNQCIWQAPIANMINMNRVPAASRLTSIIVSLHELACLLHPDQQQKMPFSTYSLTTQLALDMGGWASDVLAEDWHCFARAFFAKRGACTMVPLHFPVLCYAVEEKTYWGSLVARFVQARRHAWGVIEVACIFAFWRDTPWYQRPRLAAFLAILWKTFKLHFITIFQTPMIIGSTLFQLRLVSEGFAVTNVPHDRFNEPNYKDALWLIFVLTSFLMVLLPLITVFSFSVAVRYEDLLRSQHIEAQRWVSLEGLARRVGVKNYAPASADAAAFDCPNESIPREVSDYLADNITMPRSSLWRRVSLFVEFLLVMPVSCLIYGFLPALISQTILPFRKHYTYVVASKPQKSQMNAV